MIAKYNGIVYKDNDLQLFPTGSIFVKPLKRAFGIREFEFIKDDDTIDLNDTVTVELTEWGAVYLNALNTYRSKIATGRQFYRTDYKEGDIYRNQLYQLIMDFKDAIKSERPKPFNMLKKNQEKTVKQSSMKQTVEEAAIEAAEDCYEMPYDENFINMKLIKEAVEYGAKWQAKQSPWISVKERLPEEDGYYFVTDGDVVEIVYFFKRWNKFVSTRDYPHLFYDEGEIKAWLPIPSFDEMLEANRYVLERIKEKGD